MTQEGEPQRAAFFFQRPAFVRCLARRTCRLCPLAASRAAFSARFLRHFLPSTRATAKVTIKLKRVKKTAPMLGVMGSQAYTVRRDLEASPFNTFGIVQR